VIKLLVPDMPTADELRPYLLRIDAAKIYTNGGPLVRELESELAFALGYRAVAVSNGTLAIESALRALDLPPRAPVLVPAMTFVGTGQAVWNAGLRPILCDVDPLTWQLTPEIAQGIPVRECAVVPVAAFGMPVPTDPWCKFAQDTGIPVVIDAAGALPQQEAARHPLVLTTFSLHATKTIGAGEGGVVSGANDLLLQRVREIIAFGHYGTNAKMSEYHAAVALASLSASRRILTTARMRIVSGAYRRGLEGIPVTLQRPPDDSGSLLVIKLPASRLAGYVGLCMQERGVATKQWYRPFIDELPQFAGRSSAPSLPITEDLRKHSLGLPFHTSLTEDDVAYVCRTLEMAIA